MNTTRTPYELTLHNRPLDKLFGRLSSVFVPSHVTTLEQLSDIAQAYGNLKNDDDQYNKQPTHHHYHNENVGSRYYQQQQLQWRFFYMDTNKLDQEFEKMIVQQQNNTTLLEKRHRSFLRTLESELIKVHNFYHLKQGEIQRRIAYCNDNDPSFMKKQPHKRLSHLESEMKALPWEIQHLVHFVKANHRSLFTIVYKYDHHLSSSSYARHDKQQNVMQNQLFRLVASKPFCEPDQLFALIVSLNALYKYMRSNQLSPRAPSSADSWTPSHTDDNDDELRQVPNYTSIYVTNTAANSAIGATTTTTTTMPPRLTTTLLPSTALPPSPATTSDGEDDEVDEEDHRDSSGEMDSLNLENENGYDNNMFSVQQFWVHPDNLTEVLLYITKYMDLSESSSFPPAQVDTASRRCVQQSNQSNITTLHLDTPNLETYNDRILLGEKSQGNDNTTKKRREFKSLRMRWYEEDQSDPAITKPVVAMEEKVYQPVHCGNSTLSRYRNLDKSTVRIPDINDPIDKHHQTQQAKLQKLRHGNKECTRHRLWLKSKNMDPWLSGHWSLKHLLNKPYCQHRRTSLPDQCNSNECNDSLLREQILQMENDARLKQMKPVLKTMLCRTVFADHESELIISIDTEIAIARHTHDRVTTHNRTDNDYRCYNSSSSEGDDYFDHQPPPPKTCISSNEKYPYSSASPDDMVRFPYAVIKICCPAKSRQQSSWLSDLCTSPLLEPVHSFSTYVHGVAVLMENKVKHLPQWLSKMDMDLSRKGKRGQLLKQQIRTLSLERDSSFENNLLQLPPTPWSTTSAFYSPTSTNSSSSYISSNNNHNESTRATTPSSTTTKGKFVSEEDLTAAATTTAAPTTTTKTRATIIVDERQPLLQKQHQRDLVESYCSFDHPSSSRSNPAQCRDCMTRRQSSSLYNKSNSNSCFSSSDSLYNKYNNNNTNSDSNSNSNIIERNRYEEGKNTMTNRLTRLMCTLWPKLGDITSHETVRSDAILPVYNNSASKEEEEAQGITSSKASFTKEQHRPNTLKLMIICVTAAATVAILLYYILNTTL